MKIASPTKREPHKSCVHALGGRPLFAHTADGTSYSCLTWDTSTCWVQESVHAPTQDTYTRDTVIPDKCMWLLRFRLTHLGNTVQQCLYYQTLGGDAGSKSVFIADWTRTTLHGLRTRVAELRRGVGSDLPLGRWLGQDRRRSIIALSILHDDIHAGMLLPAVREATAVQTDPEFRLWKPWWPC